MENFELEINPNSIGAHFIKLLKQVYPTIKASKASPEEELIAKELLDRFLEQLSDTQLLEESELYLEG